MSALDGNYELCNGDSVWSLGVPRTNDGPRADVPYGHHGRVYVSDDGEASPDGDGDVKVVWDDHRFNDQSYDPGDDISWLYAPMDRMTITDPNIPPLDTLEKIEEFLK